MARADRLGRGGGKDPGGEAIGAFPRARRREQLEERARPEQVEVPSVGMGGVEVTEASVAAAAEAVLEAGLAVGMKTLESRGAGGPAQNAIVDDDEGGECEGGQGEPEGRQRAGSEGEPGDDGDRGKAGEPRIRDERSSRGPERDLGLRAGLASSIDLGRRFTRGGRPGRRRRDRVHRNANTRAPLGSVWAPRIASRT